MFGHMQRRGSAARFQREARQHGLARLLVLGLVTAGVVRAVAHRGAEPRARRAWHA